MTATHDVEVAVIGAGIAGLVAAVRLQRAGIQTLLVEERESAGGLLTPASLGDIEVDGGAESFAIRNSSVAELIDEFELPLVVVSPSPSGAMLLGRSRGHRVRRSALPHATVLGIPSNPWASDVRASVGLVGAVRASLDALLPRRVGSRAASIGELVQRRMGRRVRIGLVDPIARSVYSTAANDLDVDTVSPRLRPELAERGSLARAAASITSGVRPGSAVNGIEGGLWRLAAALAEVFMARGGELWTGTRAGLLSSSGNDGVVFVADRHGIDRLIRAREVIMATPGPMAGKLTAECAPQLSGVLGAADFRGVTVACVRIIAPGMDAFPVGSGVIIAANAGLRAKALTHMNAKWDWLPLPAHEHVLRLSFDGADPETQRLAADRDHLSAELATILGVPIASAAITDAVVTSWPDAVVPLDSETRRDLAREVAFAEMRNITCVGSWASGPGLASVIPYSASAADRVIGRLHHEVVRNEREL